MPLKIVEEKPITLSQVKTILEETKHELNQFQRKTLDYASTFSKLSVENAEEICRELIDRFGMDVKEAAQTVNCMPASVEELRMFFPRHKVIEAEKLCEMIKLLDEYRDK